MTSYYITGKQNGRLDTKKKANLRDQLARVRAVARRNGDAKSPGGQELARIAGWLAGELQGKEGILD